MTRSRNLPKLLLSTSVCTALSLPTYAANQDFSRVDTNGDQQLDKSELAFAYGTQSADRMLARDDGNNDGTLSENEVTFSHNDGQSYDRDDGETNSGGND